MSKLHKQFSFVFLAAVQILLLSCLSLGQQIVPTIEATISIESNSESVVSVTGKFLDAEPGLSRRNLSFLRSSAGIENLGDRISDVRLSDKSGKIIVNKKIIPGEYVADSDFNSWSYKIDLRVLKAKRAAAHISWHSDDVGLLMLDDLLPKFGANGSTFSAKITLEIPGGWRVLSVETKVSENAFEISDVGSAVFLISKNTREQRIANGNLNLIISGKWLFSDEDAAKMAGEIYREYRKIFDSDPSRQAQISILKFPAGANAGSWEAGTRGSSVTILSADMPFKSQSLQRLHEQLRHEIFHLWLPNGVNLSGNYDWFYEGFALYQALKTGVLLNQIRFDDLLETLSRAHNIESMQSRKISLIEASKNRWNGADTQIYARGMLVAFLCDLELLQKSKGKKSVSDIFRRLFHDHRHPKVRQDGNAVILAALRAVGLSQAVENYIEAAANIDWQKELSAAGIENQPGNLRTNLRIKVKLSGSQRALLDKLGYNNWRKLSK